MSKISKKKSLFKEIDSRTPALLQEGYNDLMMPADKKVKIDMKKQPKELRKFVSKV